MITAIHTTIGTDLPLVRFDHERAVLLVDGAEREVDLLDSLDFEGEFRDLDTLSELADFRMKRKARR